MFSSNSKQALKSFTFSSASSCSAPTSPTNGASTSSSRVVSWTAPGSAPAGGYLVAYSSATSTAPGDAVQAAGINGSYTVVAVAAGTTTATLSALSASTTYNWWVRSKCGDSSFSSWVAGTAFTTDAPPCGSTDQAALTLSSNSGAICGTGTATFIVSGGSGTGALSVATSDPSKATASIDGSTVTVTGVAAGSATITVTKACDATYAEKTATYSATVAAIPTANAGADKTTELGNGVALAATAAADGCTGAWTIQSGPNTATSQLSSTTSATATFTPTVAGTYTLRWTVTNSTSGCSAYDEMTVKAVICSISDCGNATLTYPLNVGTSLVNTAANLVSTPSNGGSAALTVPAAGAAVTLSTITISDKDGDKDNKGKAAATTSACYPTAPTMSSKIGMYNGASYSSSNYLQFAFTVNSGYTFTPCDIEFTVQPVSHEASFRWEVTDGTNIYGYGVATDIPVGSSGGASVMTGLTSTTEMEAGDYYIRLYPYYNGSNTFRISNNVILKGTTASAAAPSTYSITYSCDGATSGCPSNVASATNLPDPLPSGLTKTGYVFDGWYTNSGKTDAAVAGAALAENTTLYAKWTEMPPVTNLAIDDGATLSSIPLSWTIPGICDLSNPAEPIAENNGTTSSMEYSSAGNSVAVEGKMNQYKEFGVGFTIPSTTNIEWMSFEYTGSLQDEDGLWIGVCDDDHAYWHFEDPMSLVPDNTWQSSGEKWIDYTYWGAPYTEAVSNPLTKSVKQVAVWANATNDYADVTRSFSIRNVRYHVSGQNDIDHIVLMRKEGSAATDTTDASATRLYSGTKSHYTDASDVTGKNYYYTVFAVHASGAVSTGTSTSLTIYTITYDAGDDGTGTVAADKKTHGIDFTLSSSTFTREGFSQDGWSTSDGEAKVYELGGTYSEDADATLYPHWVADAAEDITNGNPSNGTISITDGVSSLSKASAGATVTITATPATGYNFTSWDVYKTGESSTKVSTAAATASTTFTMPSYAVTVDASFSAKTYTVTLNGNGGSGNTANVTATYNSSTLSSSITNPTKTGYIFDGWYSGSGGTGTLIISSAGVLQSSTTYSDGSGNWTNDGNVTLYAKWITILPATLDKSNYSAESDGLPWWTTDNDYFDIGPNDAANTDSYVEWSVYLVPCNYSVSITGYYPNGHEWKVTLKDTEKSYSTVRTWSTGYLTEDDGSTWDLSDLEAGVYTVRVQNVFEYSQPKLLSLTLSATVYTVTYDANGGTCGTESETVCGGSGLTLPSALGDGAFEGWYTSSDEEKGGAGDSYVPTADITLYAHWGASCSDPEEPTDFDLSSSTMTTATFSITDGGDAASYDLYYASGSPSTPTSETTATQSVTTKTPTITGLTASTEYKIWVRSVCDASHKSAWVALDAEGGAFTTPDPKTYIITYNKDGATEDQIDDGEKTEGTNFTLSSSHYTKAGYRHVGWATSQGGSKVYDFGGTYSTDADLELYPAWVKLAVYNPDMSTEAKLTATIDAEFGGVDRWTLTTDAYLVSTPKNVSSTAEENLTGEKYGLAFTPSWSSNALYDLGAQTTLYQLTLDIVMGGNGSLTAQLLNGSSGVVKTLTDDIAINGFTAWEKKTFTYTYDAGLANVRYIRIYGNGVYVVGLTRIKAEYAPTKTEIVLDSQSATSDGTTSVTATYGASTNLTSDITVPTKTNYIFGGYYTEESGAGTQLIDENGAWLASKTDYTDGSKNWQFANPDLTLYAKWTAKTTPTKYNVTAETIGSCNEASVTIILEDSEDGVTYELYKDGSATGTTKTGTGEALSWSGITAAGEYTIWTVEDETYASVQMDNDGYTTVTVVVKDDAGLEYGTTEVAKTYGDAAFTNTLTNDNSLSVTYSSSAEGVATVNSSGLVTIAHAGSTTITASFAGDATYCAASVSYELTVAKADLSVSPSAGTASSVTHYSATLPFTLGSTSGVASVTLKVYKNSDNSLVATIEGVTAATSGSGNVTGLDAETTYYYTVTPIGDADHNDGAESSKSATFTTSAATLSALVAGTLYEVPDMIPGGESLTSGDQFFEGLSANTKFTLIGSASSSTTPKVNNSSSNDKTIAGITFDDGSMWFKGTATVSENIPSTFGLSFIVPSAGKLYLYFDDDDSSTNIKLAKSGTSGSKPTVSSGYSVVDVTSGTYYMYGTSTSSPYSFYGLKFVPTYDITLHDNNGGDNNGSADVAVNGTTLLDIDAPTRSGYIVTGYYAESDYTTLVADEEGNLEANVTVSAVDWTDEDGKWVKGSGATLYAKWGRVYTVTFNTDGGSSVDAITQTSEGGSITMPAAPTKDGYTFQGWYIGSTSYAVSASYTPTADITAYASWKAECGVIKWDFTNRTEATLTANKTTSYTADDGVTEMRYSAGSSDKIVAYDSKKSIDGHLYENGATGSGTVYDIDDKTNVGKTRLIRLFVEPGSGTLRINCNGTNGVYKVLDGSASGTTLISSLSANTTSSSITLTTSPLWIETTTKGYINDIRWTPSSTVCYYVTYNGNGADGGYVNDPEAHSPGDNVTTLANSFTRTGCTFTGWNTAADGSGTAYVAGGTISSISGNVTLYAQWKITVSENKNLSEYTSDALSTTDVVVTNGATLTVTEDTEVRNITVETGSTLNVNTTNGDGTGYGVMLTVHSLSLKGGWNSSYTTYDMPRIYIDPLSTLTKSVSTVNFDISVDHYNYYPFAVPFRVKVSDINYADPTLAYYAQYGATGQYVIKEYDGERRAEKGPDHENNWKVVPQKDPETNADIYLEPGRGYIMTAVSLPAYGGGIIRIPLSFTNAWTALGEQGTVSAVTKNIVPVTAYTGKATEGDKFANKGWNLLGVPFMSCYTTSDDMGTSVVMQGKFNFETGEWDGEDKVRYVNVPVHDFSEYIQVDMEDEKTPTVLRPGWCFFVQIGTTGNLTFLTADQAASSSLPIYAPKREKANMPTVKTGIILSDGEKSDQTTFLVSDRYSAMDYEINADLEKLFGNGYTLAIYSLSGETRLAYNALSNADAANIIPIGYRAPAEGEYTFSINPSYAENGAFESVNLIDYETGIVTDLSQSSYTFSTERTQDDARFALNVVKAPQTATDITVTGDGLQVTGPQKVIINDKLYIIVDGRMYDAKGAMVK
ncbi:MAG: InlB B-repeat-containing protein [Paludibacteraceae bacterium]|nr:InlB B-repeat-containing protein [Paludibacteraceae bacterium]